MKYILSFLAIYTLSHFIRNLSGPFNLFGLIRNKLMTLPAVGVFFYELFDCPWCLGFHCGYLIYLLQYVNFQLQSFIIWGLAGSSIVAIMDSVMKHLYKD